MFYKEIFSGIAMVLTIVAFVPYIRSIMRGTVRPHVFSWVIWSSVTLIVFLAQLSDRGGVGAWPIGLSGLITIFVAFLAYRRKSDDSITPLDWVFLVLAMTSIPLWYVTADPLWAVVVLTIVDLIGFGPTLRKAYGRPFEEQVLFFVLMGLRNVLSIIALENHTLTTILFPAATAAACAVFIAVVLVRRRVLA